MATGARQLVVQLALEDDGVILGVVGLLVDPETDGDVGTLGGRTDDHLAHRASQMLCGQLPLGEEAGGFDDQLDPLVTPRDLGRIALGKNPDGPAVHDHGVSIHFHALLQPAVNRVVAQQVGQRLGTGDVIDGHDFHRVSRSSAARNTFLPIRPKPLIPTLNSVSSCLNFSLSRKRRPV